MPSLTLLCIGMVVQKYRTCFIAIEHQRCDQQCAAVQSMLNFDCCVFFAAHIVYMLWLCLAVQDLARRISCCICMCSVKQAAATATAATADAATGANATAATAASAAAAATAEFLIAICCCNVCFQQSCVIVVCFCLFGLLRCSCGCLSTI